MSPDQTLTGGGLMSPDQTLPGGGLMSPDQTLTGGGLMSPDPINRWRVNVTRPHYQVEG